MSVIATRTGSPGSPGSPSAHQISHARVRAPAHANACASGATTRTARTTRSGVTVSDQLRALAHRVERLAVGGRTDPEEITTEKQLISRALRRLATEADR